MVDIMKLQEFIEEERQKLVLFEAWWTFKMDQGQMSDGSPMWPEVMMTGEWDEQFNSFDVEQAKADGITLTHENGEWIAVQEEDFPPPIGHGP